MSEEKIFVNGMIAKRHPNAPDFVKASLSLKMSELIEFARQHHKDGWLNIQIKESKGGKYYAELDTWEPSQAPQQQAPQQQPEPATVDFDDDIPF